MAIFGQQSKNVIFSDAKSAVLKKKAVQIKYNPVSALLAQSCPQPFYIWQLLGCSSPMLSKTRHFNTHLCRKQHSKAFPFVATLNQNKLWNLRSCNKTALSFPQPALILTLEEPDGRTTDTLRAAQALFQAVPSHTVPPGASNTRRWGKPQTLYISQGKIISCFSSLEGGWGKTTCEGGLQPALRMQGTNISHPQNSPLTRPVHIYFIASPSWSYTAYNYAANTEGWIHYIASLDWQ